MYFFHVKFIKLIIDEFQKHNIVVFLPGLQTWVG